MHVHTHVYTRIREFEDTHAHTHTRTHAHTYPHMIHPPTHRFGDSVLPVHRPIAAAIGGIIYALGAGGGQVLAGKATQ